MTDRKSELTLLLRDYFTRETAAAVLGTHVDTIDQDYAGLKVPIGDFALYPVAEVAKKLQEGQLKEGHRHTAEQFRALTKALASKP